MTLYQEHVKSTEFTTEGTRALARLERFTNMRRRGLMSREEFAEARDREEAIIFEIRNNIDLK